MKRVFGIGAGLIAAAAMMHSQGGMVPARGVSTYAPTIDAPQMDAIGPRKKLSRKVRERQNRKARRARDAAHLHNKPRRRREVDLFMLAINSLTNYQRNRWVNEGKPGKKGRDPNAVYAFRDMVITRRLRRHCGAPA